MAKAKVTTLYNKAGKPVLVVRLPPGGSTGWHFYPTNYRVTPLTHGTMKVEISDVPRVTSTTTSETITLDPSSPYTRNVDGGKYIRTTSKERSNDIVFMKA